MTRVAGRRTELLFLAAAFTVTWEKIHWSFGGNVSLEDILAGLFVASFVLDRLAAGDGRLQRTGAVVLVFLAAFLLVYLIGFFNLDTKQALDQYVKGLVKFFLHFGLLACGVAYLARRSVGFYWRTLTVFTVGLLAFHQGVEVEVHDVVGEPRAGHAVRAGCEVHGCVHFPGRGGVDRTGANAPGRRTWGGARRRPGRQRKRRLRPSPGCPVAGGRG